MDGGGIGGIGGIPWKWRGTRNKGLGGWRIGGGGGGFLKYLIILCVFCEFDIAFFGFCFLCLGGLRSATFAVFFWFI